MKVYCRCSYLGRFSRPAPPHTIPSLPVLILQCHRDVHLSLHTVERTGDNYTYTSVIQPNIIICNHISGLMVYSLWCNGFPTNPSTLHIQLQGVLVGFHLLAAVMTCSVGNDQLCTRCWNTYY